MDIFLQTRYERLRADIRFGQDRCLEIGALAHPILYRKDGNVFYVDRLSKEALKKQFWFDADCQSDQLVDVDFVWEQQQTLKECVKKSFDFIIASHVAEHVPDLIGWINQAADVLTPTGQLRLVFPDGRYSFDMKRQTSRLSDLLAAWMKKLNCPDTHLVLDFSLNKVEDHYPSTIHSCPIGAFDPTEFSSQFDFAEALEWGERTLDPNHYEDVHCWVLHLNLFAQLMILLSQHDIIKLACVGWYDIEPPHIHEFMVFLSLENDRDRRTDSWKELYEKTKPLKQEITKETKDSSEKLQQENAQLKEELRSVYQSSSWRITAPLRTIMKRLKD